MKKEEVWEILRRSNFTGFMERLNGSNPPITQQYLNTWKEGSIMLGNQRMEITEEVIAEATGSLRVLISTGRKNYLIEPLKNLLTQSLRRVVWLKMVSLILT